MRCAALTPWSRSETGSCGSPPPAATAMPAVRRLTEPRTRTAAISPKLRTATARNTSTASSMDELSENRPIVSAGVFMVRP
jgi:hypothetical protein